MDSPTILAPMLLDRLLDDDPRTTSPFFTLHDLLNPYGLACQLMEEDSIAQLIRQHIRQEVLEQMSIMVGPQEIPSTVQEGMLEGLNKLIDRDCIFDQERFQDVNLAEETIRLLQENPQGRGLMFLNRMLLEDVYPRYLRTRRVEDAPYTLSSLKASVSRDIEALLNTRREQLDELPPVFKELQSSLLNYGLPDFSAMSLMNPKDRKHIRRAIEQTILTFEPRLKSVEVTVLSPTGLEQALNFRIDALLQVEPDPEPVRFDAVLQLSTAKYEVKGQ